MVSPLTAAARFTQPVPRKNNADRQGEQNEPNDLVTYEILHNNLQNPSLGLAASDLTRILGYDHFVRKNKVDRLFLQRTKTLREIVKSSSNTTDKLGENNDDCI